MRYHHVLVMEHHQKYFARGATAQRIGQFYSAATKANAESDCGAASKPAAPRRHEVAAAKVFGN
jgi:hypothetical protein